jgi:glycerol uptake facilitator protein
MTTALAAERKPRLSAWWIGEFVGTFLLVFFGCGSVAAAVLTGAQVGVFQVAIVWGLGIATAIYLTGSLSGAHLNPAVTLAFAAWRGFPWSRVPGYVLAQFAGAFAAAAVLHGVFGGVLEAYEEAHGIVRGAPGSEATAMIFGEFFPNPSGRPLDDLARLRVSAPRAFFIEALATALLVLIIFGVTDERNASRPRELCAAAIGLTVTLLISLVGPLTMAGLNPARDLAPRLWSALAGWGAVPFTANGLGWLMVYMVAPTLGAVAGGAMWRIFLAPGYVRGIAET